MSAPRAERMARVQAAMRAAGIGGEIVQLRENTATAARAAEVLGCAAGEIAKSLVFRRLADDAMLVAVLSGAQRADTEKLAAAAGGKIAKADARFVLEKSGYEIGGVPPLGHDSAVPVFVESGMLRYEKMWAAAGSAHAVFAFAPAQLAARATAADFAAKSMR
ncbi:MAG: YbaK/EbsC family protein [Gammaproteobacteria bacterium]